MTKRVGMTSKRGHKTRRAAVVVALLAAVGAVVGLVRRRKGAPKPDKQSGETAS